MSRLWITGLGLLVAVCFAAMPATASPSRPATFVQAAAGGTLNALTPAEAAAGWTLLFDGRTLNGWVQEGKAAWKVEDDAITVNVEANAGGNLRAAGTYANFEMTIDFWTEKRTSNSGVHLRGTTPSPGASGSGGPASYEVNISDASTAFPTGSLVDVQSTLPDFRAESWGTWNTLRILADGDHFVVTLNGRTTVDARDGKLAGGSMALQGGGTGLLKFRNIKIRRIDRP